MSFLQRCQTKWQVSLWGAIAILIAFSLAGMSVVRLKTPILSVILPETAPTWLYVITYLILIFPLYQILLLIFGSLLGQFSFFWDKEKKLLALLLSPFRK